jgi:hypothetical protein
MLRAFQLALLTTCILTGSVLAQRGGTFRGNAATPLSTPGLVVRRNFSNRFFPSRFLHGHEGLGILVPYYEPFGYEQPYEEAFPSRLAPLVLIQQRDDGLSQARETPVVRPRMIEVPRQNDSVAAKPAPPTIFILTNAERLETRRFVLTVSNLSVSVDRQQRVIPIDMLDIEATVIANRERGVDLRIPVDPSEISLSF